MKPCKSCSQVALLLPPGTAFAAAPALFEALGDAVATVAPTSCGRPPEDGKLRSSHNFSSENDEKLVDGLNPSEKYENPLG